MWNPTRIWSGPSRLGGSQRTRPKRSMWGLACAPMLASLLAPGVPARAEESPAAPTRKPAVIHFADLNGIESWKPESADAILVEGRNHSWYRARFFGPCFGIQSTESIGFVTDPTGNLDRFSSILVDGQRCFFASFDRVDPPDPQTRDAPATP